MVIFMASAARLAISMSCGDVSRAIEIHPMDISQPQDVFSAATFAGRVYGITGGAHGIGNATVTSLCRLGARVLILDNHPANLQRAADQLSVAGAEFEAVLADVSNDAQMLAALDQAHRRWGRIDGWVNNAFFGRQANIIDQHEADFQRAWEVSCLAAWRICRHLLPHLASTQGSIVNISSVMSHQTEVGSSAYTSSKAALEGLTRSLAMEFAPQRVRVNMICPGYILSYQGLNDLAPAQADSWPAPMRTMKTWLEELHDAAQVYPDGGRPADIANAILFLLSSGSRFITGSSLTVDGGLSVDLRDIRSPRRDQAYNRYRQLKPELDAAEAMRKQAKS